MEMEGQNRGSEEATHISASRPSTKIKQSRSGAPTARRWIRAGLAQAQAGEKGGRDGGMCLACDVYMRAGLSLSSGRAVESERNRGREGESETPGCRCSEDPTLPLVGEGRRKRWTQNGFGLSCLALLLVTHGRERLLLWMVIAQQVKAFYGAFGKIRGGPKHCLISPTSSLSMTVTDMMESHSSHAKVRVDKQS
jgi:hypothetical protein